MLPADRHSGRAVCPAPLLDWVKDSYLKALKLYGPEHPLTRSWRAELRDLKTFSAVHQA